MSEPKFHTTERGDNYCSFECPFFRSNDDNEIDATCMKDGKDIGFYDWYLAHCREEEQ